MDGFKEVFSHFNVYDFLNPIISGFYFIAGVILVIGPGYGLGLLKEWEGYFENGFINGFLLLIFFYLVGIVIEWLSHFIFSSRRRRLIESCLTVTSIENCSTATFLNKRLAGLHLAYRKCFPTCLNISEPKRDSYIENAKKTFKEKGIDDFSCNDREHNSYYMAHCEYTNQIRGISGKTETLREIWGLSRELCVASLIISIIVLVRSILINIGFTFQYERNELVLLLP